MKKLSKIEYRKASPEIGEKVRFLEHFGLRQTSPKTPKSKARNKRLSSVQKDEQKVVQGVKALRPENNLAGRPHLLYDFDIIL